MADSPTDRAKEPAPRRGASGAGKAECAYCEFMRGSPCGAQFEEWERCYEHAGGRHERKCRRHAARLKLCIEKHPDYDWQ